jgi:chromosome segregation protein
VNEFKEDTQFIVITHNPRTMQTADDVYGVTMQDPGVSTIVGVRLGEHEAA